MEEGKLPLTKLKELLHYKGKRNEGIVVAGKIGLDVAVLDDRDAKSKALKYYESDSDVLTVIKSDPITFPTSNPGKYAVIVNANDISCSGAVPYGFLSTIIAPKNSTFDEILQIQEQIHLQCLEQEISILGGHTEVSDSVNNFVISGHMLGYVPIDYLVPNKLSISDRIIIIGYVGAEGTGIIISEAGKKIKEVLNDKEISEGIEIGSQIEVVSIALEINKRFKPSLIHDATEGGIYGALFEIIVYRDVGIRLEEHPPISAITSKLSSWLEFDPYRLISSGVLIVAVKESDVNPLENFLSDSQIPYSTVGKVTKEGGKLKLKDELLDGPKSDEIIQALSNLRRIRNEKQ
ncbi:MAG: hypothetical protein KAS63_09355 [Candidatus Heimdallarchaeota archaeon]|nr:hypothetical protein [Candidatus Heimdallarchaeota archaeon]MCK4955556.1 hypothetical protein [Candidatus Heimdallarchaeota archaeon]